MKDSSEVAFNLQAELAASKARETALLGSIETANSDLAALREDLAEYQKILTSYKNNYVTKLAYNAVQSSLTAAEHRNAELVELLREAACAVKVHAMTAWAVPLYMRISKALTKPTESGASE